MPREKDTRKIVEGVQRLEGAGPKGANVLKTYAAGQEDALEAVMSEGEYHDLKARGAIEGDWKPEGEPPPIQPGSLEHKGLGVDGVKLTARAKELDAERAKKAQAQLKEQQAEAKEAEKEAEKAAAPAPHPSHAAPTRK